MGQTMEISISCMRDAYELVYGKVEDTEPVIIKTDWWEVFKRRKQEERKLAEDMI